MACEGFEKNLIEEALASTDPALLAHLAKCADCRAELAAQRELQERITAGIAAMVADEPSPALMMRVRARIAEESAPRFMNWIQWATAGVAVTALAAFAVWFAGRHAIGQPTPESRSVQTLQSPSSPAQKPAEVAAPQELVQAAVNANRVQGPARHATHIRPAERASVVVKATQPAVAVAANPAHGEIRGEVIVPAGQREAVLRLVDALRTGRVDAASLLRTNQQSDNAPLAIAPIEVTPVNGRDENDGTGHELENEF
jgi:hypothetical protein